MAVGTKYAKKTIKLLLLFKQVAQAKEGETKLSMNRIRKLTSKNATENWKKHNSKQPTVDYSHKNHIKRSGVQNSVGKVIPQANLGQKGTSYKLGHSTPRHFEL